MLGSCRDADRLGINKNIPNNNKNKFTVALFQRLTAVGTRCANHVTPLYPQKLSLTSPTGGGRSVGIVRSRTKATEFSLVLVALLQTLRYLSI
jgi:hypothetical protein